MNSLRLLSLAVGLGALPLAAAIDGTVINATTGTPQAGVTISLVHPGENGMQTLATAKSAADGTFKLDQDLPPPPALLQSEFQGVQYSMVLPPGSVTTGVKVTVFNSTNKASDASLSQQHLVVVEPLPEGIHISETFLVQNTGKTTFSDPVKGSVQVYLPKEAQETAKVTISAPPNLVPITRPPEKTPQAGVFKIGYPVKPGETEYDITYILPPTQKFTERALGEAKVLLVTAESVKLSGDKLKDDGMKELGQGGTRAHVYEVSAEPGASYEVGIEGTGTLSPGSGNAERPSEADGGPPQPKAGPARLYERLPWVLGLAFGILALGGTILYRRSTGSPTA